MLSIKRGDTLVLDCQLLDDGLPVDMTGWAVGCWLRGSGARVVHRFTALLTDAPQGRYQLAATAAETQAWPAGRLDADVRYQDGAGTVMHTCSFVLPVLDAVTGP